MNKSIFFYLIGLTVIIIPLIDMKTGANYVLLSSMVVVSIAGAFKKVFYTKDVIVGFMLILSMLVSAYIFNPEYARFSTILYSIAYINSFLSYKALLNQSNLHIDNFLRFIKNIFIAYAIVLFIQQIQSFAGMGEHIFNINSDMNSKFKMNSLSWESSNTLLIIPLLMYSYIRLLELKLGHKVRLQELWKQEKKTFLLFLYICTTSGSMTMFFSLSVLSLYFIHVKDILWIITFGILGVLLMICLSLAGAINLDRISSLLDVLFMFDAQSIIDVDPSAATRIVPYLNYLDNINPVNIHFWFGHGIDRADWLATDQILWYQNNHEQLRATNITSSFYNYGFFMMLFFLIFLRRNALTSWNSFDTVMYVFLYTIPDVNHYILWIFISYLFMIKHFRNKKGTMKVLENRPL